MQQRRLLCLLAAPYVHCYVPTDPRAWQRHASAGQHRTAGVTEPFLLPQHHRDGDGLQPNATTALRDASFYGCTKGAVKQLNAWVHIGGHAYEGALRRLALALPCVCRARTAIAYEGERVGIAAAGRPSLVVAPTRRVGRSGVRKCSRRMGKHGYYYCCCYY